MSRRYSRHSLALIECGRWSIKCSIDYFCGREENKKNVSSNVPLFMENLLLSVMQWNPDLTETRFESCVLDEKRL